MPSMTFLVLLFACSGDDASTDVGPFETGVSPVDSTVVPVDSGPTGDTAGAGSTADTASGATGHTGDTAPDPCGLLSPIPISIAPMAGYPPSEEFAFDALGNMVNVDDSADAMFRTPYGGPPTLVAPYNSIEVAGTRFLPDGDLAVCDEWEGAVVRLTPAGARSVLAGGLISPNSIAVRSTGDVYVAGYGEVVRVHPDGTQERIFERAFTDFDGAALAPDELALWINHDDGGVVGRLELDANGDVVSFDSVVELAGSLDGASVDVCGNYYVVTIAGVLWRVSPDGGTQRMADLGNAGAFYTTAVRFGSGVGGWERDHLYVMDRTGGTLFDVELDVEGAKMPHWP